MKPDLRIDDDMHACCPDCRLGWLIYDAEPRESDASVWSAVEALLPALKAQLESTPLADMPNLGESRRAYRACGKDPGRWRVSSEALYRRVRQGRDLYRINAVVDVNNLVSLETGFSLGTYDRDRLEGAVVLRRGKPGESYPGIGKDSVNLECMPLLADDAGPVGSPTSDSTRAMVTPESRRLLTVIYSFSPREELEKALALAADRFGTLAGTCNLEFGIVERIS
ncbi:phenylalanine--tRNA ligase beta subunit-related protein [uncultured Mailhella sp.]|uniref:B3/B4 domain-containing protein n=1 Tax=uncultured Mailhella sp. TaxID=1981031 RepID=UPI0025FAE5A8|nr:phenylalanine--tRNA ligase beta subunit-related protein [uncultured Mailhella sp.]